MDGCAYRNASFRPGPHVRPSTFAACLDHSGDKVPEGFQSPKARLFSRAESLHDAARGPGLVLGDPDDEHHRCANLHGDHKGRVKSLDVQTGALFWKLDFDKGVQAPPVAFLRQIYLVLEDKLIVLDSASTLLHEVHLRGRGQGAALSLDHVYVATDAGIETFPLDPLQFRTFDGSIAGTASTWWATSGLALAKDGTLYVSTPDGYLHAYGQAPQ